MSVTLVCTAVVMLHIVYRCRGNVDNNAVSLPEFRLIKLCGWNVLLVHIGGMPPKTTPACLELIQLHHPDILVFGHSHQHGVCLHEGILWINPGSAGMHLDNSGCSHLIVNLLQKFFTL